eukprot:701357-Hanusia_phi.AAC.1
MSKLGPSPAPGGGRLGAGGARRRGDRPGVNLPGPRPTGGRSGCHQCHGVTPGYRIGQWPPPPARRGQPGTVRSRRHGPGPTCSYTVPAGKQTEHTNMPWQGE